MLTKDAKKRADWSEVFNYEITYNGEILNPKLKGSTVSSNKASTTGSSLHSTINPPTKSPP
jgi:spermidine/putrescine-binding protein